MEGGESCADKAPATTAEDHVSNSTGVYVAKEHVGWCIRVIASQSICLLYSVFLSNLLPLSVISCFCSQYFSVIHLVISSCFRYNSVPNKLIVFAAMNNATLVFAMLS